MKPTRVKDIVSPVAHKHGLTAEQADRVLRAYWSFVREKLGSLDHPRVMVPNLGTFNVKPWSLDKRIKELENTYSTSFPKTPHQATQSSRTKSAIIKTCKKCKSC